MSPLRATLEYHARRAGIAGAVGLFILTLLPGFYWMTIKPVQEEAARLATRIEAAGKRPHDGEAAPLSRNERIRAFVEFFPERKHVPHWIQQIHTVADKEGIVLERGEYRRPTGEGPLPGVHLVPAYVGTCGVYHHAGRLDQLGSDAIARH